VDLHDTELLKALHSNHESFIGYYWLAQPHDTAAYRHLDVVEAWKMCLRICEKLWTLTHRPKLMRNCANAWVNLSYSYGQLGCYLKSSKAARRGIDLAEKFPGKGDDVLLSTDDVKTEYMRACHSLWLYGHKVTPNPSSSDPKAEAKDSGNSAEHVQVEQAQNNSFTPQNQKA